MHKLRGFEVLLYAVPIRAAVLSRQKYGTVQSAKNNNRESALREWSLPL